jgi:hypothetical protein
MRCDMRTGAVLPGMLVIKVSETHATGMKGFD